MMVKATTFLCICLLFYTIVEVLFIDQRFYNCCLNILFVQDASGVPIELLGTCERDLLALGT